LDPQIGKKTQQSISGLKAGFWTVQMEYADTDEITDENAPPINWNLADNNEFATRNRNKRVARIEYKVFPSDNKVISSSWTLFYKERYYIISFWNPGGYNSNESATAHVVGKRQR